MVKRSQPFAGKRLIRNASIAFFVLVAGSGVLPVQAATGGHPGGEFPYQLRAATDWALFATGLQLSVAGLALDQQYLLPTAEDRGLASFDHDSVPWLDRLIMHPYSEIHHNASHALFAAAMIAPIPVLMGRQDRGAVRTIGVMYGQTVLLSFGLKRTLVHAFPRYRPQSYYDEGPRSLHREQNSRMSFPSGHTAHPFAAATFATTVFAELHPESNYRYAVAAGTYGMAAGVAGLRVMAGKHFLTDVLAGAALGSFAGWLVPRLHRADRTHDYTLQPLLSPEGLGAMMRVAL